ncbi:MAG: FG-GAP-like repeat-containing protein [bacterium]
MKRFILATILLCVFTVTCTYAGTLKFGEGTRTQSHLLKVPSHAVPVVADWTYDDLKDLIIGDENGNVRVFRNVFSNEYPQFDVGSKVLIEGSELKVSGRAAPFVVNWDEQYYIDLIVGDASGQVWLYLSKEITPVFNSTPVLYDGKAIIKVEGNNAAPCVYDWNDDNKKDLIIGDANGNIWVYLNGGTDSNPVFNQGYQVLGTGSIALDVGNDAIPYVINWDGKGNKDLVVGNSDGEVYVFLSKPLPEDGTPAFTIGTKLQTTDGKDIDVGFNAAPSVVNWDNDGDIDLLVGEKDGSLNLFINNSNEIPKLLPPSKIAGNPTELDAGSRIIPAIIDFNNDGKKDMIVGDGSGYVKLYLNSGENKSPVFTDAYTFQVDANGTITDLRVEGGYNASPYVYDWNGDKNKDLIVGNYSGSIYIFINAGTDDSPIFKPGTKATTGTGTNEALKVTYDATPIICDWNNDGNMDILVGEIYGYVNLFLNSGTERKPIFASSQRIKASGNDIYVGKNAKPFVVDFNDDGKKDLVIGNDGGYLKVYLNIGEDESPVFTTEQPYYFQVQANSTPLHVSSGYATPVVVDWNEDNIYDLIVGEENGYINLYTGTIENSLPKAIPITPVGTQSNNVTINYILKDDEQDVCSIVVKYSTDFGNTWATTTAANAGDGISNLNSSKDGIRHSFVWDSFKNLGNDNKRIIIKIIPHDGKVEGTPGETGEFEVNNDNPPEWKRIKLNGADLNLDSYSTPIVANWDKDDRRDLLIGGEDGYVYFCQNIGTDESPEFEVAYELQVEGGDLLKVNNYYSSPFVYDWDSDGDKDLLVGDSEGYVTFFENTGSYQILAQGKRIKIGTDGVELKVPGNAVPVVVDWNRDGYKDLIVGDKNGNGWLYLNKNVSPKPDTSPLLSTGIKIQANSDLYVGNDATPYMIDWDKDYKDDLIIGNRDGYVFHYKNIGTEGTPSFSTGVKLKLEEEDIKVDANSRPCVLNREGDDIDLIVGSKAGYIFLYHLTEVAMNTPPQVSITNPKGTQSTQVGSVTITYILQDGQWNTCNIKVEFSTDLENWYSATGTPKTDLESAPEGIDQTFTWFSKEDLPDANNQSVQLRFIPNDGELNGATATVSFYLRNDNNLPMVSSVVCNPTGKFGQVEISYDLQDADNDSCRVFVEYQGGSKGNTWATATVVGNITDVTPGTGAKLTWLSSVDEKNQSADYMIKITPYDIEYGTSGTSLSFNVDNSSISSAIVRRGTTTTLSFSPTTIEILEPFSNDFDVLITVEKNPKGIPPMNTLASLNNTVRKITATWLPDDTKQPAPQTDAKITIDYTDLGSYESEISLRIFELRENKWILVEGKQSVDVVNNWVTAQINHFSVFRIGLYATTFKLYPNPFKDNDGDKYNGELGVSGHDYIVFEGVSKVEIYTIAGELVRESKDSEIDNSGWKWDLKNDYGRLVGSGIYIYVAKDSAGASLVGKLGVIR